MSIYSQYEIDPSLETEGVWVNTVSDPEEFLLAAAGNQKAQDFAKKLYAPKRNLLVRAQQAAERTGGEIPSAIKEFIADVELRTFCNCVLLGWKNVKDREGAAIEYTPETAYKLLTDPRMRKLKDALMEESARQANFVQEVNADTEKNLSSTPSGS